MTISDQKSELRSELLETRKSINDRTWNDDSRAITNKLKDLKEFQSANVIHCFVSMNNRNEVDTHLFIKEMISSGKNVIVPITNFETGELEHSLISSFNELEKNKWGVLEPKIVQQTNLQIDLIIVPLLAADKNFNRLGYGKGFYDRFLEKEEATRVGLLFDEFIFDSIPVEDFDEKLDILISEKRLLSRNNSELVS
jgi:5-formyltetrahydrofolate cyclo-ligase